MKSVFSTLALMYSTVAMALPSYLNLEKCTPLVLQKAKSENARLSHVVPAVWIYAVYDSYKKYGICDTDKISNSYDEIVNGLIRKNWKQLPKLSKYLDQDLQFSEFFFAHALSSNNKKESIEELASLAKNACPKNYSTLCEKFVPPNPQLQ